MADVSGLPQTENAAPYTEKVILPGQKATNGL
jgi:hypothetical protein